MNINEIIELKYRDELACDKIILQDDGNGVYIAKWDLEEPKPTQVDLDQWSIDLAPQYQFKQNKIANQSIYDQLDIIDSKSIRALRTNDTLRLTELETQAAALRAQLLPVS